MPFEIRQASRTDIDALVPLFDSYRQFYRKSSDVEGARHFLLDRLDNRQSVIFIAVDTGQAMGFTQLFPSFSSGAMARIYILNDLFVARDARKRGVGSALLEAAAEFGRSDGAIRLVLSTEVSNTTAQRVYERLGWKRDSAFYTYNLALPLLALGLKISRTIGVLIQAKERGLIHITPALYEGVLGLAGEMPEH